MTLETITRTKAKGDEGEQVEEFQREIKKTRQSQGKRREKERVLSKLT